MTGAPPVDVERLADALRTYLVDYGIRVDTANLGLAADGDLRRQLGEARRTGQAVTSSRRFVRGATPPATSLSPS